jgi:hypothetical protein
MSDCLRATEKLDGFDQPNEQYKLDSEPSILKCHVQGNSEVDTQCEGNRSNETRLHESHGAQNLSTPASSLAKSVKRQVSSRFGSAGESASR